MNREEKDQMIATLDGMLNDNKNFYLKQNGNYLYKSYLEVFTKYLFKASSENIIFLLLFLILDLLYILIMLYMSTWAS